MAAAAAAGPPMLSAAEATTHCRGDRPAVVAAVAAPMLLHVPCRPDGSALKLLAQPELTPCRGTMLPCKVEWVGWRHGCAWSALHHRPHMCHTAWHILPLLQQARVARCISTAGPWPTVGAGSKGLCYRAMPMEGHATALTREPRVQGRAIVACCLLLGVTI